MEEVQKTTVPGFPPSAVPSVSGPAIACRWRSPPRVRRHRASGPQCSSSGAAYSAQQVPCVNGSGSPGHGNKRVPSPLHSSFPGSGGDSGSNIISSNIELIVKDMKRDNDHLRGSSNGSSSINQPGGRGRGRGRGKDRGRGRGRGRGQRAGTGKFERASSNGALPRISATGAASRASAVGGLGGGPGTKPETIVGRAVNRGDDTTSAGPAGTGEEGFVRMARTAIEPAGFVKDPEAGRGKGGQEALPASEWGGRRVTGSGGRVRKRAAARAQVGVHGEKGRGARREAQKETIKNGTRRSNGKAHPRAGVAGKRAISSRDDVTSLGEGASREGQEVLAENGEVQDQDPVVKRTKRPRKKRCVREGDGAGDNDPGRDILGASSSGGRLTKNTAAGELSPHFQEAEMDPRNGDSRHCQFPDCSRNPFYGLEDEKRAAFCSQHRLAGMVNVVSPRCSHEGCRRGPSYNEPNERKPAFCSGHRLPGMINVVSPRCHHLGCTRGPSYGHAGDRKAIFCSGHRLHGMVNVVSRRCVEDGCMKGPSYGFEGMRASFCAKHKQDGMVNVVSPRCQAPNCIRGPSYGMPSDRKPSFCAKHKLDGMMNIVTRKCFEPSCGRGTSFGRDGDRTASFCVLHKLDGMVQITHRSK